MSKKTPAPITGDSLKAAVEQFGATNVVFDALSADPNGGLTAKEVQAATGMKYSTVTEALRTLADEGMAEKSRSGRQVTWTRVPVVDGEPTPAGGEPSMESVMDASLDPDEAASERDASSTGARVVGEAARPSGPVPVRTDTNPSETAVDASDTLGVTAPTPDAGTAAYGDVTPVNDPVGGDAHVAETVDLGSAATITDVASFMEQQRPIPDPPVKAEKVRAAKRCPWRLASADDEAHVQCQLTAGHDGAHMHGTEDPGSHVEWNDASTGASKVTTRTRSAGPAREVRNDFGSGGLQGAVLSYMDEHRDGDGTYKEYGPYELALALGAHASSVAYSLKRTTAKGQTVQTNKPSEKPRFRLVTKAEADAASAAS